MFSDSEIVQRFVHKCLGTFNEAVGHSVQIVGRVLDILPGRLLAILFREHLVKFEYASDVVAFVFVQ
jgi:hypothetical protein